MNLSIRYAFVFALTALAVTLPEIAAAATADAPGIIGNAVCRVAALVTSKVGKGIATLAVIFLGIGAFFGKVNWGLAIMVSIGIVAIFGAAVIADYISGNGAESCSS